MSWSCASSTFDVAAETHWNRLLGRGPKLLTAAEPGEFDGIRKALQTWRGPIDKWVDTFDAAAKTEEESEEESDPVLTPHIVDEEWRVVEAHIWCAAQSATRQGVEANDWVTPLLLAHASSPSIPAWINGRWAWASRCVRWYHQRRTGGDPDRLPERGERTARVPVALVKRFGNDGLIGWLTVELSRRPDWLPEELSRPVESPVRPQTFRDPACSLRPRLYRGFGESLDDAWAAATAVTGVTNWDAFWSFKSEPLVSSLAGASAGGAAARAFWHALSGKIPDPGVVVIAMIDREGNLSPVASGLDAKLKAVAHLPDGLEAMDTVVVVGDEKEAQAVLNRELSSASGGGRIVARGLR